MATIEQFTKALVEKYGGEKVLALLTGEDGFDKLECAYVFYVLTGKINEKLLWGESSGAADR